jgi:hypothetical protein
MQVTAGLDYSGCMTHIKVLHDVVKGRRLVCLKGLLQEGSQHVLTEFDVSCTYMHTLDELCHVCWAGKQGHVQTA